MAIVITIVALLIVWGLGAFNLWGFQEYRTLVAIFLGIALVLQLTLRARTR